MPLVAMKPLLDHAAENGYALPALNVNEGFQIRAIVKAAEVTDSPVIIQASKGAREYAGDVYLEALIKAAVKDKPQIPICMHLDHGDSFDACKSAIEAGFSSVMRDGSIINGEPARFEENVRVTKEVVDQAKLLNVSVEGELGCLGRLSTGTGEKEDGFGTDSTMSRSQMLTDPDQAAEFVESTGVDALAVAIGTSHGAYKFDRPPTGDVLDMDRIEAIDKATPDGTHLVMHGSSSVPQELLDIIRMYGGYMKETYGVPLEEIKRGIQHGVRKVNVDTDNRLAITGAIRKLLVCVPTAFDPRKYLVPARDAMQEVCEERMRAFGSADQGPAVRKALGL